MLVGRIELHNGNVREEHVNFSSPWPRTFQIWHIAVIFTSFLWLVSKCKWEISLVDKKCNEPHNPHFYIVSGQANFCQHQDHRNRPYDQDQHNTRERKILFIGDHFNTDKTVWCLHSCCFQETLEAIGLNFTWSTGIMSLLYGYRLHFIYYSYTFSLRQSDKVKMCGVYWIDKQSVSQGQF